MRKQRIAGALTAVMLLFTTAAPAAFADTAAVPSVFYEMGGTKSAELSLGDLAANIYSVQLQFTAAGGTNLSFEPDSTGYVCKVEEKENGTAVLYLDSKVPLNSTADPKSSILGILSSDTDFQLATSAAITTLNVSLLPTDPTNVTLKDKNAGDDTDDPDVPDDGGGSGGGGGNSGGSGGGGGGSSHGGSSGDSTVNQADGVTTVTAGSNGDAVISKNTLSSAATLSVKGTATLEFNNSATIMLRSLGNDVTIRSTAVKPADESRVMEAQLSGGSGLYSVSVASGSNQVTLEKGTVRMTVPFSGTGKPVAYQVNGNGLMTRIGSAERSGDTASFTLPALSGSEKIAVLDVVHNFFDVNDWYDGYVNTMVNEKVMAGMGAGNFQPSKAMTRAELVTTLANLSKSTLPAAGATFSDVTPEDWFAPYVTWAQQSGITSGITPTEFRPNQEITREQMAVMLVKFMESKGKSLTLDQTAVTFSDASQISDYATEAMSLMQRSGIIAGKENNRVDPQGNATRGECAKMLSMVLLELNK